MADYTVGYGKDYATIQLADAARNEGDRLLLHESDQYGNTTYQLRSHTITKHGIYEAVVGGVTIETVALDPNSTSVLKFIGITFRGSQWSMANLFNLHISRCALQYSDYLIRSLSGAGTGDILIENSFLVVESTSNDRVAINLQNSNCTTNLFFNTVISKGGVGRSDRPLFLTSGTLNAANNIFFGVWTQTLQISGGTSNVDHNIMHTAFPSQANGWVKTQQETGFALFEDGNRWSNDYRVIETYEEEGVWTYNSIDLTPYNKDIDGRTRDTGSTAGASVGCSNGFNLYVPQGKPDPLTDLTVKTIASGQVTLTGTVPNATDTWFIRYYNASTGTDWSAENPTLSLLDSGDITVTGLTDGNKYVFSSYINNGSCDSDWFAPEPFAVPVASGLPLHRRIQLAVAALISAEAYETVNAEAFTVSAAWAPRWEDLKTPTILVQPDSFDAEPGSTKTLTKDRGINIAIFERLEESDAQIENRMGIYEGIQSLLATNTRPTPDSYLAPDPFTDSRAYNADDLNKYSFMTPFAVRYRARCTR